MRISNEKMSRMLLKHPAIHRTAPHYKELPSPGEFSCGPVVKNPPCNAGDTSLVRELKSHRPQSDEDCTPQVESVPFMERPQVLKLRPDAAK